MVNVRRHERRLLAGYRRARPTVRIFPRYVSFANSSPPPWWTTLLGQDAWGEILGVHESYVGVREGALVITERGVALLSSHGVVRWFAYTDVAGWERLSKEPLSQELVVRLGDGSTVALPFPGDGAFGFVQFLISAKAEYEREARHKSAEAEAVAKPDPDEHEDGGESSG